MCSIKIKKGLLKCIFLYISEEILWTTYKEREKEAHPCKSHYNFGRRKELHDYRRVDYIFNGTSGRHFYIVVLMLCVTSSI